MSATNRGMDGCKRLISIGCACEFCPSTLPITEPHMDTDQTDADAMHTTIERMVRAIAQFRKTKPDTALRGSLNPSTVDSIRGLAQEKGWTDVLGHLDSLSPATTPIPEKIEEEPVFPGHPRAKRAPKKGICLANWKTKTHWPCETRLKERKLVCSTLQSGGTNYIPVLLPGCIQSIELINAPCSWAIVMDGQIIGKYIQPGEKWLASEVMEQVRRMYGSGGAPDDGYVNFCVADSCGTLLSHRVDASILLNMVPKLRYVLTTKTKPSQKEKEVKSHWRRVEPQTHERNQEGISPHDALGSALANHMKGDTATVSVVMESPQTDLKQEVWTFAWRRGKVVGLIRELQSGGCVHYNHVEVIPNGNELRLYRDTDRFGYRERVSINLDDRQSVVGDIGTNYTAHEYTDKQWGIATLFGLINQ